jgi:hypothetical protein
VSKVTIDIYDEDPNEIALVGDMMHALAAYRASLDEEPISVEEDGTLPPAEQAGVVCVSVRGPNETKCVTETIIACLDGDQPT